MSKFKVGDKVIPKSKSTGISFERYKIFLRGFNPKYLFITSIYSSDIRCDVDLHDTAGYFFLESDLIPYEEPERPPFVFDRGFGATTRNRRFEEVKMPEEKSPVYYTLPKDSSVPSETNYSVGFDTEPDYKGFYEYMHYSIKISCNQCSLDVRNICSEDRPCHEAHLFYAEKKFIKKEIK